MNICELAFIILMRNPGRNSSVDCITMPQIFELDSAVHEFYSNTPIGAGCCQGELHPDGVHDGSLCLKNFQVCGNQRSSILP